MNYKDFFFYAHTEPISRCSNPFIPNGGVHHVQIQFIEAVNAEEEKRTQQRWRHPARHRWMRHTWVKRRR